MWGCSEALFTEYCVFSIENSALLIEYNDFLREYRCPILEVSLSLLRI